MTARSGDVIAARKRVLDAALAFFAAEIVPMHQSLGVSDLNLLGALDALIDAAYECGAASERQRLEATRC